MEDDVTDRRLVWTQLRPGFSQPQRRFIDVGHVMLAHHAYRVAFEVEGNVGSGKTLFGIIDGGKSATRWNGLNATRQDVGATRGSFELCSSGAESFYTVTIRDAELERRLAPSHVVADSLRAVPNEPVLRRSRYVGLLRSTLRALFSNDARSGSRTESAITGFVLPLVIAAACEEYETVEPSRPQSRRIKAVRECQDYIRASIGEPVSLLDLSGISGMRPRSLINAFEAVIGVSPMAYLRAARLSGVRMALSNARREATRIIDVAADWGFLHMGHFSAAYRTMFGETPSQTLLHTGVSPIRAPNAGNR